MSTLKPPPKHKGAEEFYAEAIKILNKSGIPYMIAGTFAMAAHIELIRQTKDMDIFCKAGDYPRILSLFATHGYKTTLKDERWLAEVSDGKSYFDVIYSSANNMIAITDEWFKRAPVAKLFGTQVKIVEPTDLIWSKAFIQDRHKFDGSDIYHIILIKHKNINWRRLLSYFEKYWEVLLAHIINFRFIYPSERDLIPRWLIDELVLRLQNQIHLPSSPKKICRGKLFSLVDYLIDVNKWGYADLVGEEHQNER